MSKDSTTGTDKPIRVSGEIKKVMFARKENTVNSSSKED